MNPVIYIKPGERQEYVPVYFKMANNFPLCCSVIEHFIDINDDFEYEYFKILSNISRIFLHNLRMVSPRMVGYFKNVIPMFSTVNFR